MDSLLLDFKASLTASPKESQDNDDLKKYHV
jgi:hypothetical protein